MDPWRHAVTEPVGLVGVAAHVRRASDLRGVFEDADALEALVRAGDPPVYETYEPPVPQDPGHLRYGITRVYPGRVGREYFMTRGHYHRIRGTAEVYYVLRGEGALVLRDPDGHARVERVEPGTVVYVPPGWAHRSVNTGSEPLVLFYVYPADAGHDYETVGRTGFGVRVVAGEDGPRFEGSG